VRLEEPSDNEVVWGEITVNTIPHLNHLMEYIYAPFIENLKDEDWGVSEEEARREFLSHTSKFAEEVHEAIGLMSPGQELFKLETEEMARF
jgi:dynein heavy chain